MLLNAVRIAAATLGALVLLVLALGCVLSGGTRVAIPTAVAAAIATLVVAFVAWRTRGAAGPFSGASLLRTLRRAAEAILAVCVAAALAAFAATAFAIRPPLQAEVVARFHEHQQDYEALREMIAADALLGVDDLGASFARESLSFKPPAALGLSAERASAYGRRLRALGSRSIYVWSKGEVAFPVAAWGAANHGWRVSIVWSATEPSPLVASIDDFRKRGRPRDWERASSRIEGDWYVVIVW